MIPDREAINRMYEVGKLLGQHLQTGIFDKRLRLPLSQLPEAVAAESGRVFSADRIPELVDAGWLTIEPQPGELTEGTGFHMYIPPRIALYLELQSKGYSQSELSAYAKIEESIIEDIATSGALAYEDDDLTLLIRTQEEEVFQSECDIGLATDEEVRSQAAIKLARNKKALKLLKAEDPTIWSSEKRDRFERAAFTQRIVNECFRIEIIDIERHKSRSGFSPEVIFRKYSWSAEKGFTLFSVHWPITLASPATRDLLERDGLRVPGLKLFADSITLLSPMQPSQYEQRWKQYDIDDFYRSLADSSGILRCGACFARLPEPIDPRKRHCNERCRNVARQRRFQKQNPEAADAARQRYIESIASMLKR